jgi:nicotinate-nucleotide adenylyltransferase
MRLGIFGGSFDPPHIGHLLVAQDAIMALSLDRLIVVPAATQPLKQGHRSDAAHRLAMVQRCFDGVPHVIVDSVEMDRGGLSFMVDTVDHYRRNHPSAVIHLLVGEDVVATFPRWREPERLLSMVTLVVLARADAPDVTAASANGASTRQDRHDGVSEIPSAHYLATRRVDVSSTEIRERVGAGRSIRGFVSDSVAAYIASTALYLGDTTETGSERA